MVHIEEEKSKMEKGTTIPKSWVWTELGEIQLDLSKSITPNKTPKQMFELYSVPRFEVEQPEIVSGGRIGSSKRTVEEESVLLCKINPRINRIWIVGSHSQWLKIASTEWIPFFRLDGIEPKYLCYFMQNNHFRDFLASNASGVGGSLMRIKPTTFAQYPFPLSPLPEQNRIVAKIEELFTKLDAGVEALEKTKTLLKRYRQSVLKAAAEGKLTEEWRKEYKGELEPASVLLQRILKERREKWEAEQLSQMKAKGRMPKDDKWKDRYKEPAGPDTSSLPRLPECWMWANIEGIGETSGGLTKSSRREKYPLKMPYLRVANVYAGELRLDDMKDIGIKEKEVDKVLLRNRDLLVVEGNGSLDQIGRVALWDGSISPCVHQNHIIKVRFKPAKMGKYVLYWLLSLNGRRHITRVASSTSGLYTLSISKVSALPVPLPPLAEQQKIVEEVERHLSIADGVEAVIDAELKRADRLRQSILKQAFSGKLVPQDPSDEPASVLLERIKQEKAKQEAEGKAKKIRRKRKTLKQTARKIKNPKQTELKLNG